MSYTVVNTTEPVSGQPICILVPTSYSAGTPTDMVIYCRGRGESQDNISNGSDLKAPTINALTAAGIFVCSTAATAPGVGATSWGNATAVEAAVQLDRYMRATYNIRRMVMWGVSMGAMQALNTLTSGRINCFGFLTHAPACNLADMTAGTGAGQIEAAYGIGSAPNTYAAKTIGFDPVLQPGYTWRHIPMLIVGSPDDTTTPKATNMDALAAVVAGCARELTLVTASGGHVDAVHFNVTRDVAFIQRCLNTPSALGRPTTTRTITLTLRDRLGAPRASLSGLKWSWSDAVTPDARQYPVDRGAAASTNGAGVLSLTVRSQLAGGGVGWLEITNSDGDPAQSPAAIAFSGPAQVA